MRATAVGWVGVGAPAQQSQVSGSVTPAQVRRRTSRTTWRLPTG
ncbi:hypothetical protein [Kribbella sp. NPDC000426]